MGKGADMRSFIHVEISPPSYLVSAHNEMLHIVQSLHCYEFEPFIVNN